MPWDTVIVVADITEFNCHNGISPIETVEVASGPAVPLLAHRSSLAREKIWCGLGSGERSGARGIPFDGTFPMAQNLGMPRGNHAGLSGNEGRKALCVMPLFIAEHTHAAEQCPAHDPTNASGLLALIQNAKSAGINVRGEAVKTGGHHLYVIADGPDEKTVREYFAPFGRMGTLSVSPASLCEEVVARQGC